jgi:hypothetical protein
VNVPTPPVPNSLEYWRMLMDRRVVLPDGRAVWGWLWVALTELRTRGYEFTVDDDDVIACAPAPPAAFAQTLVTLNDPRVRSEFAAQVRHVLAADLREH